MTKKLNVLLIQDQKDMSMSIKNELKKFGCELYYEIVNSIDALKDVLQNKIWDIVISDYIVKNISTLEALLVVKKYDSSLPFIIISEETDCSDVVKFMKNGCNNYINKKDISNLNEIIESEIKEAKVRIEKDKCYERLTHMKEILELTIENIVDGIITTDNTGKITTINKAAEDLTEWNQNSAIGMDIHKVFKLIYGESVGIPTNPFIGVINNKSSTNLNEDIVLVSKSGNEYYVSANFSSIIDKQDRILGTVILFRDITRIKTLENEMKKKKDQAQAATIEKSAFLANMSHEIRTPLNGIEGMIDLTLLTELTNEQRENLNIAKDCSNSLMEVINNILDFSKIEAGKMELKKVEFNIEDLIEKTVKTNIIHAKVKGVELIYKISSDVNDTFLGDYSKIQQILNNLISNAIKFTNIGSVCIGAQKLSEDKDMTLLKFFVQDTGIGILSEDIKKLFKSFSQVDGTYTRKYGGTGLGLVISKKLAELMGGKISVESIKGKGSTFYLTIKIEKFKNLGRPKELDKCNHPGNAIASISKKILIVEDNKANQEVLNRMCTKMNHNVKIAGDGKKALEILNSESFDVILMDVQMPIMDGIEATRIIRENEKKSGKHIPIIALTAYALKGDREKFLMLGMDDYLSKPVIMDDLYKCIENIVSKQKDCTFHNAEYYLNINDINNNFEDKKGCIEKIQIEIDKLKRFIEKEDFNNCENSAHSIKECAPSIKSVIMKNASFRAELAARRKDNKELKAQTELIEEEYIRIKKSV